MQCPNCRFSIAESAEECQRCGIIFAKWRELQKRKEAEALAAIAATQNLEPPKLNVWKVRGFAAAFVAVWVIILAIYYHYHYARHGHVPMGEPTGDYVELRDPQTGDMRSMPILLGPGVRRPP
jgi:hypothetical protein